MEQRVSLITLGVDDLPRAKEFYERVVGWSASHSPDSIAFFDLGGLVLALYPHEDLAKELGAGGRGGHAAAYQGFALAYNARSAEEVDGIFARLRDRGADIIKEPEEVFWGGYSGYFSDPDGHAWEIAYNPFWEVLEDGRISMGN